MPLVFDRDYIESVDCLKLCNAAHSVTVGCGGCVVKLWACPAPLNTLLNLGLLQVVTADPMGLFPQLSLQLEHGHVAQALAINCKMSVQKQIP